MKDDKNEPVTNSIISLKSEDNKTTYSYTETNENGYYELKTNKLGKYIIIFSGLNYQTKTDNIELLANQIIEKNISLNYKAIEINEIIIQNQKSIKVKNDTIIFNAKSFLKGNETVVEDLLKKIPGISVAPNGTIKIGNQEIEKIMIDGDDFFEKGYKLISKNMSPKTIEKIELYQNYSNNKHLKGIENSDKVALNLKLGENSKRQWFGNAELGYGIASSNRYEIRNNLMNFGKKNKYYFLANLNNLGNDAIGDVENLIKPYKNDGISSIGDDQSAFSLLGLDYELLNFKKERINFNNAEMVSLNSIFTLSKKTKLTTLFFFNSDENDLFRNSNQYFSTGNNNFNNTENFIGQKTKFIGFGKTNLIFDINKTKTIEYQSKFNLATEKNKNELIFNDDLLSEELQGKSQLIDQKLIYTNKFKNDKVFIISGRYINEKTPQTYSVNKFIYQDIFSTSANNIIQDAENKMQFLGIETHLLERKKKGNLIEIQLGNQFRNDNLTTRFQLKNDETIISEPINFQNKFAYSTNDLYANFKYRLKLKKISIISQSEFHYIFNKLINNDYINQQKIFYINPKISLEFEINRKNKLITSYYTNKKNLTVIDLNNNYIQNSFRSFSKGLNDFNQLLSSSYILNYTYGNWGDKFFANTYLQFSKYQDYISTNSIINQNYQTSEKILFKNRQYIALTSNIDRYIKPISSNLKLKFGYSDTNFENIINNSELRYVKNRTINYGIEIHTGFRSAVNFHLGSKWDFNSVVANSSNSFTDNMIFFDLTFIPNKKLNFKLQNERYYFQNLDSQNNKYYFMDFEAKYLIKKNNITFSIIGNNLFDTKVFRDYNVNDYIVSKTEYKLQPRYAILKIDFRF